MNQRFIADFVVPDIYDLKKYQKNQIWKTSIKT